MIIIIYFVLLSWQLSQSIKLMFILGSTRDLHVQLLQVVYYTNGFSFSTAMTKVIHVSKTNETKNLLMTPLLNLRVSNCSLMKLSDLYMWCNHCSVAVSVHVHLALCIWLWHFAMCNVILSGTHLTWPSHFEIMTGLHVLMGLHPFFVTL